MLETSGEKGQLLEDSDVIYQRGGFCLPNYGEIIRYPYYEALGTAEVF